MTAGVASRFTVTSRCVVDGLCTSATYALFSTSATRRSTSCTMRAWSRYSNGCSSIRTACRGDAGAGVRRPQVRNRDCRRACLHVRVGTWHKEADMGTSTDFVGHIDVTPPLNEAEIVYLPAFPQPRRCRRPGGPYVVPGNPMAETLDDLDIDSYNTVAERQRALWGGWMAWWGG